MNFLMAIFNLTDNCRANFRKIFSVVWEISKCKSRKSICQPFKKLFRSSVVLRNVENRWNLHMTFIIAIYSLIYKICSACKLAGCILKEWILKGIFNSSLSWTLAQPGLVQMCMVLNWICFVYKKDASIHLH